MYIFLKYIINVCGFLRNRSQFWVFIVIFVLNASKLIRNGFYYLRSIKSVKICCPVSSDVQIASFLFSIILSSVACLCYHIFPHCWKRHDFRGKKGSWK